jgi:hypothetical protein
MTLTRNQKLPVAGEATANRRMDSATTPHEHHKKAGVTKKKSKREKDLRVLVGPDAEATEFATTLAKVLSLGAPGRFPRVVALPGGSSALLSSNPTLTLDEMTRVLVETQTESGLSRKQAAEALANVVHCMLVEMVDLAAMNLEENDNQITIDAMDCVVDFVNHAASLFEPIAYRIYIRRVTYGGNLSRSVLEQMYAIHASSFFFAIARGFLQTK